MYPLILYMLIQIKQFADPKLNIINTELSIESIAMFDYVWLLEGKSLCCDNKFHVLLVQSTCLDSRFQLEFIMFLLIDEPSTSKSTFLIDGKKLSRLMVDKILEIP